MRFFRNIAVAAGFALALPVIAAPPAAQAQVLDIIIGQPPPPPRVEVIPPPPPHPEYFVWDEGHWRWDGARHVWFPGHYERIPHPGAIRVHGHWEQLPDGRWRFIKPHWE